ncbi:MAG: hypothetical protein HZB15_16150 [Actinobacteria bacterium]|nr:hypothetical protein [Actinomycetota bacterium]
MTSHLWRSRYAAVGAAVAVSIGGGGLAMTMAADSSPSSFVPITPCRIVDTRPETVVGPRSTPLLGGVPYTIQVRGTNGNCTVPANATAVNMNITSTNGTTDGFLTTWPADSVRPLSSSLNWVAGQAPTPNSVNSSIGSTGQISFFASGGTVDLVADITGYFLPTSAGASGPPGPDGADGPQGPSGVVSTARFSGLMNTLFVAGSYVFMGPTTSVTVAAGQRMTGSAMAPIGVSAGAATVQLDLCYRTNGTSNALTGFNGGEYSVVEVSTVRVSYAVTGTVVPGAGTWEVGVCGITNASLNDNNFVNGYVQVTN